MVWDAFSHKIDYVTMFLEILNLEGHLNHITGSRATAIFMNGWIFPIGGASAVEGLLSMGPTPSKLEDSKSWRPTKSHYWFKSFGDFAEWVDFAHWWSFSGEGSASTSYIQFKAYVSVLEQQHLVTHTLKWHGMKTWPGNQNRLYPRAGLLVNALYVIWPSTICLFVQWHCPVCSMPIWLAVYNSVRL